jgi:hypothetical protein
MGELTSLDSQAQKAAPKKAVAPKKATAKKVNLKFTVDCTKPVDDEVFDAALFVRLTLPREAIFLAPAHCFKFVLCCSFLTPLFQLFVALL